jgi:hypothetical protein
VRRIFRSYVENDDAKVSAAPSATKPTFVHKSGFRGQILIGKNDFLLTFLPLNGGRLTANG